MEKTKTQHDVQSAVGILHLVNESMVMETDNRELSMKVHLPIQQTTTRTKTARTAIPEDRHKHS